MLSTQARGFNMDSSLLTLLIFCASISLHVRCIFDIVVFFTYRESVLLILIAVFSIGIVIGIVIGVVFVIVVVKSCIVGINSHKTVSFHDKSPFEFWLPSISREKEVRSP